MLPHLQLWTGSLHHKELRIIKPMREEPTIDELYDTIRYTISNQIRVQIEGNTNMP